MTGRDLIIYILENGLEDEPVVKNGMLVGFMNRIEAAEKLDVGVATVQVWLEHGVLEGFRLDEVIIIPKNVKRPEDLDTREM